MAPNTTELLQESGHGTSTGYGDYHTYSGEGFAHQQQNAVNPFATNAGYAFSPTPQTPNPAIRRSQGVLGVSALFFLAALATSFTSNAEYAQQVGHLSVGASIASGICSAAVALLLYGFVAYLMHRRENTGRMIGIGFSLVGIIMGLWWAFANFMLGTPLGMISGVLFTGLVITNAVWLHLTNQPKLYRGLRR